MVGYDRHSETERVLVCNDRLATLSMLKIQSVPYGNIGGAVIMENYSLMNKTVTIIAATFDGDEMNAHFPQNVLAETELRHLAAIQHQLISPSGNSPIIGIFQDAMIGSYRFTRPNINFTPREAMNLLMMYSNVDVNALREKVGGKISSFDIISQILPPFTITYKTNLFDEDIDEYATTNNVLEIRNGKYIRGQFDKSCFGSTTKGIIHRICNDFGSSKAASFIDDIQNIVTEYMKSSSFSVGISDLIANKNTQDSIIQVLTRQKQEVQSLIDKVHLGIFENNTSLTNFNQFETNVNNILNEACNESGKIGRKSLNKSNRFVMIVNSGSKGSPLNISQMISCLGQTNVDGKRIPYGFDSRTLPHYSKFDDTPNARGFIENSYISGLTAPELFFHAMGGRIGLIDTAVKSVTWETPIVIIENNESKYIEIGRWIDEKLESSPPENVQHFTERQMELLNISKVYIPTTDEDGVVTWGEITAVTRHDPGDQLYEIKTEGGRSVIVTESKSLLIWDAETKKLRETATPDIKVGDSVPVTGELCDPPTISSHLQTNSGNLLELSYDNGMLFASLSKEFPVESYTANINFVRGLVTGYFSTNDGVITDDAIEYYDKSKKLVEGINMLCSRLGIYGTISFENGRYVLRIRDKWAKLFAKKIKLADREKNVKLRANVWSETADNTYNNVVLDKIVEINLVDVKLHPKVYDLTIPSTLNFGLANGLQVRDTSQTGYIQRRLIKGLEDLKVEYDMTVRNNKGKIIQFSYGDDGFDSTRVENQVVPLVAMSTEDIYMHYDMIGVNDQQTELLNVYSKGTITRLKKQRTETKEVCKKYIEKMIAARKDIVEAVFNSKDENMIRMPVSFQNMINNIQGQLHLNANSIVDITPLEAFQLIEEYLAKLNKIQFVKPNHLYEIMYYFYLSPKDLLTVKRFHRKALTLLLETIILRYKQAIVHPGEMVGIIAGQSLGEPTTQLTLNSVTYETEILVRNVNGEIEKVSIGEFTERGIATSQNIQYMKDKDTTYAELVDYYEVPSATEDGQTVWRQIEAVTRHPVINEDGTNTMLKITTLGCREVIVTKAKSLLKLVDGKIQGVNGSEIKVGDYLPCSRKALEYKEQHVLDLKTILSPLEYIYTSEIDKAKTVVDEYHWWSKYHLKLFTLPYSRSDSAYRVVKGIPHHGNASKSVEHKTGMVYTKTNSICNYMIPENIDLDYDFGYLVGAYAAEGCMTKHQISIANNDLEFFVPIKRICEKFNLTTKIYVHENKIQEGWTSTDMRIYSTVMSRILENLCGKLSHNKFVSPKIVFSNSECIRGFLDAYISGDGSIDLKCRQITMGSVSQRLLLDTQIMCKNLGVIGKIIKLRKPETNNRGTKPENIHQPYLLFISNNQAKRLAGMLNLTLKPKQERAVKLSESTFQYEHDRFNLTIPNCINGKTMFEDRNERMMDTEFDEVIRIQEVSNTTNYAYDLTVTDTKNFDIYAAIMLRDTFHSAGVSSKSNVTRGVPRIEEILRLTKNPKNPSLTVHLNPIDETDRNKATQYSNMMEHTKLVDVIKSVQICFDPTDSSTTILEDKLLLEQFREFDKMIEDCINPDSASSSSSTSGGITETTTQTTKSKWLIRLEIDPETLLDKNITMDDIHFAISNAYTNDASCIYSDYNDNNLVFRIRMNNSLKRDKDKKRNSGIPETLDQSDDIYMLRNFQDALLNNVVLRGVNKIRNVTARKMQKTLIKEEGKYVRKDTWILDTTGTNLMSVLSLDYIDSTRTYSNDIKEIFDVLGIEATRQVIFNEFSDVMEFSGGIYINYHHLSILCDRMTSTRNLVSIFRSGILNDDIGPISKSTFEVHTEVLLSASRHADFDHMRGVSANIMMGQTGFFGTGCFQLVMDMSKMQDMEDNEVDTSVKQQEIDRLFGGLEDVTDICSKKNVVIKNNLSAVTQSDIGQIDDDYEMGF